METRNVSTAILYLLKANDFSAFHRIRQDEVWHFYSGGALRLVMISPEGRFSEELLGHNMSAGACVQYVVPAGYWFGARPVDGSAFSFVGCTVAPGFDFDDFELAERSDLLGRFPLHRDLIESYTRQEEAASSAAS